MDDEVKIEDNIYINQALKEFKAKQVIEQTQKTVVGPVSDVPKIVQLVMKWSGFKEQKQAEYVLLVFVIVAIGVSLYLIFKESLSTSTNREVIEETLRLHPDLIKL